VHRMPNNFSIVDRATIIFSQCRLTLQRTVGALVGYPLEALETDHFIPIWYSLAVHVCALSTTDPTISRHSSRRSPLSLKPDTRNIGKGISLVSRVYRGSKYAHQGNSVSSIGSIINQISKTSTSLLSLLIVFVHQKFVSPFYREPRPYRQMLC
jgi:hypothetical protein